MTQDVNPTLSMYSNWQASPASDEILKLSSPVVIMSSYDSRSRGRRADSMVISWCRDAELNQTHSSYWQYRRSDEEKSSSREEMQKLRDACGDLVNDSEPPSRKVSEEVGAASGYSGDTDSDANSNTLKRVRIFEGE